MLCHSSPGNGCSNLLLYITTSRLSDKNILFFCLTTFWVRNLSRDPVVLTKVTHWFSTDDWATPEHPRQFRSVSGTLAGISGMARRPTHGLSNIEV